MPVIQGCNLNLICEASQEACPVAPQLRVGLQPSTTGVDSRCRNAPNFTVKFLLNPPHGVAVLSTVRHWGSPSPYTSTLHMTEGSHARWYAILYNVCIISASQSETRAKDREPPRVLTLVREASMLYELLHTCGHCTCLYILLSGVMHTRSHIAI